MAATSTDTTDAETTLASGTSTGTDTMTTGDTQCQAFVKIIELVDDAAVEFPMVKEWSQMGEGTIAASPVAELGAVEFTVDLPCEDDYVVWARVFDPWQGTHQSDDPDSYYVRVDGDPEIRWVYGCQTDGVSGDWTWQRIRAHGDLCADAADWVPSPGTGQHFIKLRNREGATNADVRAAVARILVTNDPNYVPTNE